MGQSAGFMLNVVCPKCGMTLIVVQDEVLGRVMACPNGCVEGNTVERFSTNPFGSWMEGQPRG